MDTPITRIELDENADGVFRSMWYQGWKEGQRADEKLFLRDRKLLPLLQDADKKGWSVTQFTSTTACLLRGEIVRVDIIQSAFGIAINQYPYGWKAMTRPIAQEMRSGTIDELIAPYEEMNWKVFKWVDGARAFHPDHLHPVRSTQTMHEMRQRLIRQLGYLNHVKWGKIVDLAYEL